MASIFTYETEPIRVASPWPLAAPLAPGGNTNEGTRPKMWNLAGIEMPALESLADCGISKLAAEPQEGPTEYKLHLLLRPRRSLLATSTVQKVSGSYLSKSRSPGVLQGARATSGTSSPGLAPSNHSRQNRLQHLTTQLLWRLQQSSPHHSSSKSDLVLPVLPEAEITLSASKDPGRPIVGLEESLGALYEIGVSDDGTFVGLTLNELEESLHVLRAMAHSLGCNLRALRLVVVGDCQWEEETVSDVEGPGRLRNEKLWVTEILVAPHLKSQSEAGDLAKDVTAGRKNLSADVGKTRRNPVARGEHLRVSLTGSTTSGKSSLLGTLSTSTLDNGRGKSRLSLLKHRHEIVSGVTSSLAQELIGYRDIPQASGTATTATNIVNYSSGNVSSWTDIHNSSEPGRLVFVTDSAGHPKFRRTTVRGLISWAPHWTLCCVAADDDGDSTGKAGATASSNEVLGSVGQGLDLSKAHLELCLKLDLPLVVIITKLDLASRKGLRQTVAKVLSTLKSAGRRPALLAGTAPNPAIAESQTILQVDEEAVRKAIETLSPGELPLLVPIVLTSALTGTGIGQVHALLRQLPVLRECDPPSDRDRAEKQRGKIPGTLFHVDEIFRVAESTKGENAHGLNLDPRFILSGYLRYGSLETADSLLLGPFFGDDLSHVPHEFFDEKLPRSKSFPGISKSLPKDLTIFARSPHQGFIDNANGPQDQIRHHQNVPRWQSVKITSLRYLRLPVRKLLEGQVGTVAISASSSLYLNAEPCLRRGMILSSPLPSSEPPPALTRITAVFADPNIYVNPGSTVTIYTASIRAPAKIVEVKVPDHAESESTGAAADVFAFDDGDAFDKFGVGPLDAIPSLKEIEITFQFTNSREWVEMGTKLLVTPASGISMLSPPPNGGAANGNAGSAGTVTGLDGFVGRIVGGAS